MIFIFNLLATSRIRLGGTFSSSANFLASGQLIFFSAEAFSTASKIARG